MTPLNVLMLIVVIMLMISLGLTLQLRDFTKIITSPKPFLVGLFAQMILLPLTALLLITIFKMPPIYSIGIMLIACSPGGPGSNLFTAFAKGDIALSICLTGFANLASIITMPTIMAWTFIAYLNQVKNIPLSFTNTLIHMSFTVLLPIVLAMFVRHRWSKIALRIAPPLQKLSLTLLLIAVLGYIYQYRDIFINHGPTLVGIIALLIIITMLLGYIVALLFKLNKKSQKAIIMEVGIQNAGQSILIAIHPLLLNDPRWAFPAMIYGVTMYFIVLPYMLIAKKI